jgi:hypothetical protein
LHVRRTVRDVDDDIDDPDPPRPIDRAPEPAGTDRSAQLRAAVDACREVLADYEAGLLSDVETRQALFRAGLVQGSDEAWCLDLELGAWQRYDGISLRNTMFRVSSSSLSRWRSSLDQVGVELAEGEPPMDGKGLSR